MSDANASIEIVRSFLSALQARDVEAAQGYLASDARIVVPGGRVVGSVREIVANSSARYRSIGKRIERCLAVPAAGQRAHEITGLAAHRVGRLAEWP
jgi:limonene-1,2-epoxide hydrolase